MIDPSRCDIGRRVAYRSRADARQEFGRIVSFDDRYVFVKYDDNHHTALAKATLREDLEWIDNATSCETETHDV